MRIPPRVLGLVLAGGRSARMGRDKASIDYHGAPQVDWTRGLLGRVCAHAFVSRAFDAGEEGPSVLHDLSPELGPVGGVLAAHAHAPDAAWLVVACDLPGLREESLARLVSARSPERDAICYGDAAGRLEPLVALYEPPALVTLAEAARAGELSLSRHLLRLGERLRVLEPADAEETVNVNTPEELRGFLRRREPRREGPEGRSSRRR